MTAPLSPYAAIHAERELRVTSIWPNTAVADLADATGIAENWHMDANCASADWALFEPPEGREGGANRAGQVRWPRRVLEAARYCVGCPVLDRCKARADAGRETGVWAGEWRTGQMNKYRVRPIPVPRDDAA